jgi:hypothetical protein
MRTYVSKNYIQQLEEKLGEKGAFNISIYLLNYYYQKCYKGEENDQLTLEYMDYVFWDILPWIGRNYAKLNQSKKKLLELNLFITKAFIRAKIQTHNRRRRYFYDWINFHNIPKEYDNSVKLVLDLLEKYPDIKDLPEVKRELDLLTSLESLKLQVGEQNESV